MISVCIPSYNCDITTLVMLLLRYQEPKDHDFEIVVIDDASMDKYKVANRSILGSNRVTYIELDKNIGRSAIRNLFFNYTKFEYLLFLDCDSIILSPNSFLRNYFDQISDKVGVTCGGRKYSGKPGRRKYVLRWKFGVRREFKMAKERSQNPYHSFMTNNFLIKRDVLEAIKFEEKLKGYGHEDSLFGYQLMKNNISIKHIDNPTAHDFTETSDEFLKKTRQGIENLLFIHISLLPSGEFVEVNKLLKTFEKTKRIRSLFSLLSYPLLPFFAALFRVGIVALWCFDAYKLLYLCRISKTKTAR
jgi:glycosyltransferase involved in cell wall biosynthesis